jgi:transposase-like protein
VSARRLNDNEKKEIVNLYRESSETAMSLAEQYGVSNTTISRILKAGIESSEYDRLIQQKRRGGDPAPLEIAIPVLEAQEPTVEVTDTAAKSKVITEKAPDEAPSDVHPIDETTDTTPGGRRIRRRTTVETPSLEPIALPSVEKEIVLAYPVFSTQSRPPVVIVAPETLQETSASLESSNKPVRKVIQVGVAKRSPEPEILDDDDDDILPPVTEEMAAILEEDFDEDEDEDDQDDDDQGDDEDDEDELESAPALHVQQFMQVLPLDQASIPRVCYLVVDRSADLVLRPLKDFGDMGQVPPGRDQILTLPIFDNPRVAKRFANARTERVIKIPDSQIFYKTADKLLAKGITYLYIDGQLYSL